METPGVVSHPPLTFIAIITATVSWEADQLDPSDLSDLDATSNRKRVRFGFNPLVQNPPTAMPQAQSSDTCQSAAILTSRIR